MVAELAAALRFDDDACLSILPPLPNVALWHTALRTDSGQFPLVGIASPRVVGVEALGVYRMREVENVHLLGAG